MKRKLLVLGSDYGTIDVVREAHNQGLYVIVADLMKQSPTKAEADEAWLISTTDTDALEDACLRENVSAISFGASDFNITQGRKLCKRLNLPTFCENDEVWSFARDKRAFKQMCKKVGVPIATDYVFEGIPTIEELEKVVFPVVVKPVDKSGNRGMSYCNSIDELKKAIDAVHSVSDNPNYIVERLLEGTELTVNYVLNDGEAAFLYSSSDHAQPGFPKNIYSIMITTQSCLNEYMRDADKAVRKLFKESGLENGIAWVQGILDKDGKFYVFEMGYRFGGEMSYSLYERVAGFNSIKWYLDSALGIKHTSNNLPKDLDKPHAAVTASYFLFAKNNDVIDEIKGIEKLKEHINIQLDLPKGSGDKTVKGASMGIIRIYGDNIYSLIEELKFINQEFDMVDSNGDRMFITFDDYQTLIDEYHDGLKNA